MIGGICSRSLFGIGTSLDCALGKGRSSKQRCNANHCLVVTSAFTASGLML